MGKESQRWIDLMNKSPYVKRECDCCGKEYTQKRSAIDTSIESLCSDCDNPFEFDPTYWSKRNS